MDSILRLADFRTGGYDTSILEKNAESLVARSSDRDTEEEDVALAVAFVSYLVGREENGAMPSAAASSASSRWREFGKRNGVKGI